MKRVLLVFGLIVSLILSGCSKKKEHSSSSEVTEKVVIQGKAVDGYIAYAKVCLDKNENGVCDSNELSTTTDENGKFSLRVDKNLGEKLLIITGGIDIAANKKFFGTLKEIVKVSDGDSTNIIISPLTTLAVEYYKVHKNEFGNYEIAKENIKKILGVNIDVDTMEDEKAFKLAQKAYQTAKILSIKENIDFNTAVLKVENAIEKCYSNYVCYSDQNNFIEEIDIDDSTKSNLKNILEIIDNSVSESVIQTENSLEEAEKEINNNIATIFPEINDIQESINDTKDDDSTSDANQKKLGKLKFKVINPTLQPLKVYVYEAKGDLVATPDKLANAIDKAKKVNKEYIKTYNNEYEISMPQTSNAAVAIFSYDKQYGLVLSEKQVKSGETTDLGGIKLLPTKKLTLKINSFNNENVGLKMNLIGIDESVPTNQEITINNVPQGQHLITVSRDGKIVLSKYIDVNDDMNVEINLSNYELLKMRGEVVDENNNPIESALIFLKPTNDNYLIALSDNYGNFEFDNLMDGNFTLIIQKSGYKAVKKENIQISGSDINIGTITLQKDTATSSITGYAYFNDSNEHAGIDITIEKIGGGYETNQVGTLKDGAFLITDLPEGRYILHFGKSADSSYTQEDMNVEVVAGTTKILEKPVILKHLLAYISGVIKFPDDFTSEDLATVEIKACDENGKCYEYTITSLDNSNSAEFNISVPSAHRYTLYITGKDAEGNDINTIVKEISSLNTNETYSVNTLTVTYVDPNPPVITSVSVTKLLGVLKDLGDATYLVNPGDKIKLDVTAQDKDGDEITYYFSAEEGTISEVDSKTGIATYQAPNEGGDYTITVTADDGNRKTSKTIIVKVNHYPLIQLISPTDITDKNNPKEYEASEVLTINTDISDVEDDDNLSIEWYSSLQGKIDENTTTLNKQLIPGTHKISVYAKDSLGLISSKEFYVKVNPQNTVWLRTSNSYIKRYVTTDGIVLNDTYQISIASDYNLKYKSNDENVVTVDENGLIQAVNAGSAIVTVYSDETDESGNPLYSFDIYVRVVDDIKNAIKDEDGNYHIKPGQVYQIRVNENSNYKIIPDMNFYGNYEFVLFDRKIINGYDAQVNYYINNNFIKTYYIDRYGESYISIKQFDLNDEHLLKIINRYNSDDELIKIALLPASNVLNNGKHLPSFFFDSDDEFNDISQLAKEINFYTAIISQIRVLDYDRDDYYYINITKTGSYEIVFNMIDLINKSDGVTDTSINIVVEDPNGNRIVSSDIRYIYEPFQWLSINATQIGKYKIHIYYTGGYFNPAGKFIYSFAIYPSIDNGLLQDDSGEVNDMDSMATPITLEQVEKGIKGDLRVRYTDEADWYQLHLPAGKYELKLEKLAGTNVYSYIHIEVEGADAEKSDLYVGIYTNDIETTIITIPNDGIYKIHLYSNSSYTGESDYNCYSYYKFTLTPKD